MNEPGPTYGDRFLTRAYWARGLLVGLTFSSCVLTGDEGPSEQDRSARSLFDDLISRGRPVEDATEEFDTADGGAFRRVEEQYADRPDPTDPVGGSIPGAAGDGDELDLFADLVDAAEAADSSEPPRNPYLDFGSNIIWYPAREGETDRLIMKPYTFPKGSGEKIFGLFKTYASFPLHASVTDGAMEALQNAGPQPLGTVLLDFRPGFSVESYSDPRKSGLTSEAAIELSDVLFVTAAAEQLLEVEHFIDLFAADVRQIEVEAKIVEVTTREALDLGVKPIDGDTPIFGLPNEEGFLRSVGYSFPNGTDATEALFQLGSVFDGVTFDAVLEAVASFENVSIISRPKVAVREGARAEIVNVTSIPFYEVAGITASGIPTTSLKFKDVGVQMYVIPRVIGRDTVILNIDIEASQSTGTAASFIVGGSTITVPEIAKRNARTIVRLEPGQAVILGGLISERTVERESKVPFLGDIPLLGILFRNRITSKEKTNVLFFIRPRILEGSDLNSPFE